MPTFTTQIRPHVQAELDAAASAEARGHFQTAFHHLERAHVLGQLSTALHVRAHLRMLAFALRHDRIADAFGQLWRLVGAALLTVFGLVPLGNTGGSDVSGWRGQPVPGDLQRVLDEARSHATVRSARAATASLALFVLAAVGLTGCGTPPRDLDLSLDRPSAAGVYRVELVPPARPPAINELHSWIVRLAGADGVPVHGATFAVDGGMPRHGHGLPTRPRVTAEVGDGVYRLDGMKFSMTGWWEVKLAIQGTPGSDQVTFNTVVSQPPLQR